MNEDRVLGDYLLIKQIGQGSMGTVYVSEQRFTKKKHIIKILPEEFVEDRGFLRRFEEEVAQMSLFDHPNIVKIHTVCFAQGYYFLVTDCIVDAMGDSCNLYQYCLNQHQFPDEKTILSVLLQVARGLDYVHEISTKKGQSTAFHGGIKLNNILIGGANEEGHPTVHISDWGLSRIIGSGTALTRTFKNICEALEILLPSPTSYKQNTLGQQECDQKKISALHQSMLQNFSFLAPEQKRPNHKCSHTVDTFAFGVLAYYLLMGEYPEGYFALPSTRYKNSAIDWDTIITKTMHAQQNERPERLTAFLEEILQKKKPKEQEKSAPIFPPEPIVVPKREDPAPTPKKTVQEFILPIVKNAPSFPQESEPTAIHEYPQEKKERFDIEPILTEMVSINEGLYIRGNNAGCRDEMPAHKVFVSNFAIDIHPVTNEQFIRFLQSLGSIKDLQNNDLIFLKDSRIKKIGGKFTIEPGYVKHPVVGVTWYGAAGYCHWVGKRLPTEAEWEIACLGGLENVLYPCGDAIEKNQANFFSADTTVVMSYPANGYNIYDMVGNVYEWCYDWYDYGYYQVSVQEPDDPKGPVQGVYRVLRGGCWKSLREDLHVSKRHRNKPSIANGTYGFRCAKTIG